MLRHRSSRRRIAAFLAAALSLALSLAMTTCGLEYLPSLVPPENGTAEQGSYSFTFSASENHDPVVFEGYELYYKLYTIDEDTRSTENNLQARAQLTARSFLRLASEADTRYSRSLPLIEMDPAWRGLPLQITVTFPVAEEPYALVGLPAETPVLLRRGIPYPVEENFNEEYQRFEDVSADDIGPASDIRTQTLYDAVERGDEVYLAIYALSYGRQDFSSEFYSDAHYLGEILIRWLF